MADLNLEGNAPANPTKEDKEAKHTKRTEKKPIKPPDMVGTEFQVQFGNIDRVKILMLEYLNKNIVELTRIIKLMVPEDKLKKYEEEIRDRSLKQG